MTKIISAFPALGKTTLTQNNKEIFFDYEIYESRATIGLSDESKKLFFENCAKNLKLIYDSNFYKAIFITDDDRFLFELQKLGLDIIHVLPDANNSKNLEEYKSRVIKRSGQDWFDKVLKNDMDALSDKVKRLTETNEEVYFVKPGLYLEDLVPELNDCKKPFNFEKFL